MKFIIVILSALVLPYTRARYFLIEVDPLDLVDPLKPEKVNDDRNEVISDTAKVDYDDHAALDNEPMVENIYDQYLSDNSGIYHKYKDKFGSIHLKLQIHLEHI